MKRTPGPWGRLLAIVERIDATPVEDFDHDSDVLIDLNCWLMDADGAEYHCDPRIADAAPELLYACRVLVRRIMQEAHATADTPSEVVTGRAAIAEATEAP